MMRHEIKATWGIAFKVWWSMLWRTLIFVFGASFIASFILGFILRLTVGDIPQQYGAIIGGVTGFAVSFPIMLWIYKTILNKSYKNFRITIVET